MNLCPPAGRHGGDGARVARSLGLAPEEVLDLSASLNPVPLETISIVMSHAGSLARYPDLSEANASLAMAIGVELDQILLTNGGSESIWLVAAEFGGHVIEPEFSLHPRGENMKSLAPGQVRENGPLWCSNPHNPTGLSAREYQIDPTHESTHESTHEPELSKAPISSDDSSYISPSNIWDEAFYPLAKGEWTRWNRSPEVVIVGSLTKLFACPGLRLGYVLADPSIIARIKKRQIEWSVNSLAANALPDLLKMADLVGWANQVALWRKELHSHLESFGLEPLTSDANFILCANAKGLREQLYPFGIVVRDCTSFGLDGYVRIAVPNPSGLDRLVQALEQVKI